MMIGKRTDFNQTVQVHPWSSPPVDPTADDTFNLSPTADDISYPYFNISPRALQRYLQDVGEIEDFDSVEDVRRSVGLYACDNFHMFEFKVKKCMQSRSHDWTDCPFAHPGEKARRRDPRKYHYSGTACPDFRKESCKKGDACEFAHGVFECWLHPARYRTEVCKDGITCQRKVCFFAHSPDQLRVVSPRAADRSPDQRFIFPGCFGMSPESVSPLTESPPMSPLPNLLSRSLGSSSVNEIVASLHQLQLNRVSSIPSTRGIQVSGSGFGSPRLNMKRPVFFSLPTTPTQAIAHSGLGCFDIREKGGCQEEPVMERVESGRDLRAKIFEKLSKENSLNSVNPTPDDGSGPDIGWVSELVK